MSIEDPVTRLERRLFGDDGEHGAIGVLTKEVHDGFRTMNGRVRTLERIHIAQDAVENDRRIHKERITAERRWRVGVIAGLAVSIGIQVFGFLFGK